MKTRQQMFASMVAVLLCTPTPGLAQQQQDRATQIPRRGPRVLSVEEFQKLVPAGVTFVPDIAYREGNARWKLDLIMPKERGDKPRPALVLIHGGGWARGNKRGPAQNALRYAKRGYVCISVNYRLTDEAPFPACVEDVKCAVRWFRAHANKYNVDPKRIGGTGHSAGAHLVAMLGVAGPDAGLDANGPHQDQSSLVNAVCGVATPTDFVNSARARNRRGGGTGLLAGPEDTWLERAKRASPITYASETAPPFLLVHGTEDRTVPVDQAKRFAEALRKAGAKHVDLMILDGAGHTPSRTHPEQVRRRIESFFDATIGNRAAKKSG